MRPTSRFGILRIWDIKNRLVLAKGRHGDTLRSELGDIMSNIIEVIMHGNVGKEY